MALVALNLHLTPHPAPAPPGDPAAAAAAAAQKAAADRANQSVATQAAAVLASHPNMTPEAATNAGRQMTNLILYTTQPVPTTVHVDEATGNIAEVGAGVQHMSGADVSSTHDVLPNVSMLNPGNLVDTVKALPTAGKVALGAAVLGLGWWAFGGKRR